MNFDQMRHTLRGVLFEWVRQPERALEAYVEAFRANPRHVVNAQGIAWIHAQKQRWPEAASWFQTALDLEPEDANTWFNLGYVREQRGEIDGALEAFARTAQLNPKHDRAWYGMGMIHAHRGEHAAAADALQKAADLQPHSGPAWYALGMARHHCNQPDQVQAVVEHCVRHDPQSARRLVQETQRTDLSHLLPF